jgi:hypothetical protein
MDRAMATGGEVRWRWAPPRSGTKGFEPTTTTVRMRQNWAETSATSIGFNDFKKTKTKNFFIYLIFFDFMKINSQIQRWQK